MWSLLKPEASRYALGLLALFIVNLADALAPVFLAVAIDLTEAALVGGAPRTPQLLKLLGVDASTFTLMNAVLLYMGLQLMANIARYPMLMFTAVPSHRIGQRVRLSISSHLLNQSQRYYDSARSGDLMSLATSDVNAVRMMVGPGVLVGMDTVFLLTLVLAVMFGLSWQLTLIAMIPLPVIALITNRLSLLEFDRFEAVQEDIAQLTERARESFAGIRIIQGYAREPFDRARFEAYSWRHFVKNMQLARVRAAFDPTLDLMMGASTALVFVFGGLGVLDGSMTLGTFVAFLFLVNYLSGPMVGFGWSVSLFQRGRASLNRVNALLQTPVAIEDVADAAPVSGPGALTLQNLSFSYGDDGELALSDLSAHVPSGTTLGVIGQVGSGKSTLARLLVRLYEPPEGAVLIDDQDVRHVALSSLRQHVVLAPQDTFLFSDTVARNILMSAANPDADVTRFTRMACLHDEILALEEGYDTMLGERGVNLSGGQRQRLAIARAIAADPKVLILDDCLSAVDARTEEAILKNLEQVFQGRTGVIISHRVRAVERCDQIIVLEHGRVVERGTHAELMAQGGIYARIALEQSDRTPVLTKTIARELQEVRDV